MRYSPGWKARTRTSAGSSSGRKSCAEVESAVQLFVDEDRMPKPCRPSRELGSDNLQGMEISGAADPGSDAGSLCCSDRRRRSLRRPGRVRLLAELLTRNSRIKRSPGAARHIRSWSASGPAAGCRRSRCRCSTCRRRRRHRAATPTCRERVLTKLQIACSQYDGSPGSL